MSTEFTTHECPTCGLVHLPHMDDEAVAPDPAEHVHVPEEQWYVSTTDNRKVWTCRDCGRRVEPDGSPWRP